MVAQSSAQLRTKTCQPCEGGVPAMTSAEIQEQLAALDGWEVNADATAIHKQWTCRNFTAGLNFLNEVGRLAEQEGHHPDLHLEGYRKVRIELSTHAIGGLSENDFIVAAKIDQLPVELKKQKQTG